MRTKSGFSVLSITSVRPNWIGAGREGARSQHGACKGAGDSRGQLWAGRGFPDSPPATPGWPGSACKAPPLRAGAGAGEGKTSGPSAPPPRSSVAPAHQVPPHPALVPPTGVGLGEGVEVQQVPRKSNRQMDRGRVILKPTASILPSWVPGGGMRLKSHLPLRLLYLTMGPRC